MADRYTDPRIGPCPVCGKSGPKGLFQCPAGYDVCASCDDDVTGESARRSLPHPDR